MLREAEADWRGAYERMFVRYRDHIREEVRQHKRPYLDARTIDELAWREAERSILRAINMNAEAEQRQKKRAGQAA